MLTIVKISIPKGFFQTTSSSTEFPIKAFARGELYAILFIFTIGGFGIWWIIDFILIVTGSMKDDRGQIVKVWVD